MQNFVKSGENNSTFTYNTLSLNNNKFEANVNVIYPRDLEIKDTTDSIVVLYI